MGVLLDKAESYYRRPASVICCLLDTFMLPMHMSELHVMIRERYRQT